jgi:hypothetical protein
MSQKLSLFLFGLDKVCKKKNQNTKCTGVDTIYYSGSDKNGSVVAYSLTKLTNFSTFGLIFFLLVARVAHKRNSSQKQYSAFFGE